MDSQLKSFKRLRERILHIIELTHTTTQALEHVPADQEQVFKLTSDFLENLKMVRDQFMDQIDQINNNVPTAPSSTNLSVYQLESDLLEEITRFQNNGQADPTNDTTAQSDQLSRHTVNNNPNQSSASEEDPSYLLPYRPDVHQTQNSLK
eukprot:gene3404-6056_t